VANTTICGIDFDQFVLDMEAFHGGRAPGIVVGGLMIEAAIMEVAETPDLTVVVETYNCLPDAAQVLTHCTTGNGGLIVYDWGKFALSALDKKTRAGVRTHLVMEAVAARPLIDHWFNPSRYSGNRPAFEVLAHELMAARSELIGMKGITMKQSEKSGQKKKTALCPDCGESYFLKCGSRCSACQGMAYFEYT